MANRGVFITFEGMDGCGKSTQLRLLAQRLRERGRQVVETAEPGGTRIGRAIREILLDGRNHELAPTTELLLYFASRAQNVDELIAPALERGDVVLSDRFTDSSLAYQGCGRGLGADAVLALDRTACGGLKPDLTLLIDIDPATGLARVAGDRMEQQEKPFYEKVREAYRALAASEPQRIRSIDGNASVEVVAERVWEAVREYV